MLLRIRALQTQLCVPPYFIPAATATAAAAATVETSPRYLRRDYRFRLAHMRRPCARS